MHIPKDKNTLITAQADHNVWTLQTEEPEIIYSLTCPRPAKSIGMVWQRISIHSFIGRFHSYPDVRASLYRLTMRSCTYDFSIQGDNNQLTITALDRGHVDRLPKLEKHSKKGRHDLERQKILLESRSTLDAVSE